MKGKRLLVILLALVLALTSFTACGWFKKDKDPDKNTEQNSEDTEKDKTVELKDKALGGALLIDFTKGADTNVMFESDGWSNGDVFNVVWTKDNVKYEDGKMALTITKEDKVVWVNNQEVTYPYTAGEMRSQNYYGYGDYKVTMKPSANPGTASTFFICTGNYDEKYVLDENGNVVYNEDGSIKTVQNPHDEIDIEFLGKDTTKVQFNFFVNGQGGNEYMYDLGFDASKEYHEYGFRWEEDSITWFVDGEPVYKVTTDTSAEAGKNVRIVDKVPATPGRILMNHWCGTENAEGWMGKYEGNTKDNGCEYKNIYTTAKGNPLNPEIDETEKEPVVDNTDKKPEGNKKPESTKPEENNKTEEPKPQDPKPEDPKPEEPKPEEETIILTDEELDGETLIDFAEGADASVVFESDGWSNGDVFNVVWTKENVQYEDGKMLLGITREDKNVWLNNEEVTLPYTAGEARTQNYFGYGDYEVKMKPSANPGTASTFFICTGNYDEKYVLDENGNVVYNEDGSIKTVQNPHDEIDIEFLGKDTTKVQFNFFVNGQGGNEYMYDLGFDAAEEYHEYGFRWEEDSITWFIDGEPVYKVTTDTTVKEGKNVRIVDAIPATPGRILMNHWCGNERAEGWMGVYEGQVEDEGCEYKWVKTTTKGEPLNPTINTPGGEEEDIADIDWTTINAIAPTFATTEKYTVTNEGTSSHITYDSVGGSAYINVEMDITDVSDNKNVVHFTFKNNAATAVQIRVNVVDSELLAAGAKNSATNKYATMDGEAVRTDLEWGGSFFDVAAGDTVEAVISFGGDVEKLQLMIDSSRNDANTYAGDITVSDIKFSKVGEIEEDDDPVTPPVTPTWPESGDTTTTINGTVITFAGNIADGYGVNANDENNTLHVVYNNIVGNEYKNIWVNVSSIAGTKNIFRVTIANYGEEDVTVRIDIESQTAVTANTTACNLSATQGGVDAFTDLEWGGSTFTIPAGSEAPIEIIYDASCLPTNVKIFFDSSTWDDPSVHAGEVVLSAMEFAGEYVPEEDIVDPEDPPAVTYDALHFNWANEAITATPNSGDVTSLNMKYTGANQAWGACVSLSPVGDITGKNTFALKITNNADTVAKVRIDLIGADGSTRSHVSAEAEGAWYKEVQNDGVFVVVGNGTTVTVVITYDAGNPPTDIRILPALSEDTEEIDVDVTVSEFKFSVVTAEEEPQDPPAVTYDALHFNWANEAITATPNSGDVTSLNMKYTGANQAWGACVSLSPVGDITGKNTFALKITNNADTVAKVRIDLIGADGSTRSHVSAEAEGAWYKEVQNDGVFVVVGNGTTVTVVITYDAGNPPTDIRILPALSEDTEEIDVDVTISEFKFSVAE